MEVMGLMLGDFVDDYTVRVVDVFAMPQSGTGVSVEAVDPVFQTRMLDMLRQVGRPEMVVGWYHSHPGFGPWLSSVDINTQMSFEQLNKRAVAVVIDPIQSVKGKVVIDAFRLITSQSMMMQTEPRQTTSHTGHLHKPNMVALIHGLNRHYYSLAIEYRKAPMEQDMLLSMRQQSWTGVLSPKELAIATSDSKEGPNESSKQLQRMASLAESYAQSTRQELEMTREQLKKRHIGRQDPKRHLRDLADTVIAGNTLQIASLQTNAKVF